MSHEIMDLKHDGDFTIIKLANGLTTSTLFCLGLLAKQYMKQETKTVVIEVTENFSISDEAKKIPKKHFKLSLNNIKLIITGPKAQSRKLKRFLFRFIR